MDAANDQNAQLRDLNSKFIKELRAARRTNGDTVAAAEKHREAADAMVRVAQSISPLLLPYPSRNNRIPKYHPNSTTTSLTNHPRELQVSAARVENMQLKALHERLTAELSAAQKATAAAETAAEKRAVAGAEAAKMASQDNARLRDVNVELVKALKLAQKVSLF